MPYGFGLRENNMETSKEGMKILELREGIRLKAYKDSVGILTIGVGHTSMAGKPMVVPGMVITQDQCDEIFARDIKPVETTVNNLVKVPLTQNQFDALVSFVFNIGGGAFSKSTLLRKLNEKDYAGAADQFLVWVKQPELTGRRKNERAQFLKKDAK
jgi:lysozyme